MENSTGLKQFIPPENTTCVEIASVNYDQWILTVAVRLYEKTGVLGMTHVIFDAAIGFRVLNEGDMLMYPFPSLSRDTSFVHKVSADGWLDMERKHGNLHITHAEEYVVVTTTECVSVISCREPKVVTTFG